MAMTPEASAPARRSRWRRWIVAGLLVGVFAFLGYAAWREYDFRQAVKEAKALGWDWTYDDPLEAIGKDWKAAFRKGTWTGGKRFVSIPDGADFERQARLLRRLAPKSIQVYDGIALIDLSSLKNIPTLRHLYLNHSPNLRSAHGLEGFILLEQLSLYRCSGLTNIDALKGLTALKTLDLFGCTKLTDVEALKGLTSLETLNLSRCTGLTVKQVAALQAALPKTMFRGFSL